jgi:transcriptional regulator with PAS, ATPase and Fis domain
MISTEKFSAQVADKTSDALAILKQDIFVYATNSFEKLYNPLDDKDKQHFHKQLHQLGRDLQQSGKTFIQKKIALSSSDSTYAVFVYLLNKSQPEGNHFLVVLNPGKSPTEALSSMSNQSVDSSRIYRKPIKKKLSPAFSKLIGEDPNFKAVLLTAQKAAKSDYPVLISGESGTGKEILARTIHRTSQRKRKKFVDINCAAIPDELIDSELFGYEKGAFTGATPGGRHGLFFEAHQGTLFFDEVADASLQTQAKLLRVLNEGYFKRIGGTKNIDVDVRIISATNKDLPKLIQERRFRDDLIYRLNTISIHLPPLRERPIDIPLLANFFLKQHVKEHKRTLAFSANCLDVLQTYHWPGNVRELKGVIDYAVTMATGSLITENYFPDFLLSPESRRQENMEIERHHFQARRNLGLLSTAVQHTEKEVIKDVLQQARNRSEAIKILGISRRTFYAKLKQYKID